MKQPGPDHPIVIASDGAPVTCGGRVLHVVGHGRSVREARERAYRQIPRVRFAGHVIAETTRALTLTEGRYPPVQYIPRADAIMAAFTPTTHRTHCPYKGDASYFSLSVEGRTAENAVWSYEQPYPAVQAIATYLAFYPERVDGIEQE